jgi:hypothetical protein
VRNLQRSLTSSGHALRKRTAACLLAGAALAAGGCGESPATSLSAGRAARWHDTIAGIRAAAAAADRPTALAALTRLSGYVDRDAQAGQLVAADAAALKAGIAQARRHLPQPAATPATALAARAAPPPPPVAGAATQTSRTTTSPTGAAGSPGSGDSRAQNNDAHAQDDTPAPKDAAKAQKDAAKAQKDAAKAQKDDAKPPKKQDKASQSGAVVLRDDGGAQNREAVTSGTKAEPKKVKAPKAGDQGVEE